MDDILEFSWCGADGSIWPIGRGCGVRFRGVPEGLQGAGFQHLTSENARTAGWIWTGKTDEHTEIGVDVLVGNGSTGPRARQHHSAWRASLGRGAELGRFVVTSSESGLWWHDARLGTVVQAKDWQKPGLIGETPEKVVWFSDSSWWKGAPETIKWAFGDFVEPKIMNWGTEPAWAKYTLYGPGRFVLDGGKGLVYLPPMVAGQSITIDTDIEDPTIVDQAGNSLWRQMSSEAWFHEPVQPGLQPVTVMVTGGVRGVTRAEVTIDPLRAAAW